MKFNFLISRLLVFILLIIIIFSRQDNNVIKLSDAMNEINKKNISKQEFSEIIKHNKYYINYSELELLFEFIDTNKDDKITLEEWEKFSTIYVMPFEECLNNENSNYLLDEKGFEKCFNSDKHSKTIDFRLKNKDDKFKHLINILSSNGNYEINFFKYFFIKKTMFSWNSCHSDRMYISVSSFKCALETASKFKINSKLNFESIYNVGLKYQNSDLSLIRLDFISFMRILYYYHVFSIFNLPYDKFYISKEQYKKALKEDRLPYNLDFEELDAIYNLLPSDEMDFESFTFFLHYHKLFNKYSKSNPLQLNKSELLDLLKDEETQIHTLTAIDNSISKFTQAEYLEASLILQKFRDSEKDFFNFRQDASEKSNFEKGKEKIENGFYMNGENKENREIFFSIMCEKDKDHWNKITLYKAFQIGNLFTSIYDNKETLHNLNRNKGMSISSNMFINKLKNFYDKVSPPFSKDIRIDTVIFKNLPREIYLDYLTFLSLFTISSKLEKNSLIEETKLKLILKDLGMENIPDTVIDLAKKSYDSLKRRVFFSKKVTQICFLIHSAAGELARDKKYIKDNKIKTNSDPSRKYPIENRRQKDSPLVKFKIKK